MLAPSRRVVIGLLVGLSLLVACGRLKNGETELDKQLRAIIDQYQLSGDPSSERDLPEITDPVAQLGLKLFFTKALSGDDDVACASCHHPMLGGGDDLSVSIGIGADDPDLLGPGRSHPDGPAVPRNAPTTFNIAMWDQVLFHDGRVESLGRTAGLNGSDGLGIRTPDCGFNDSDPDAGENLTMAQSRFPVTSPDEMKGYSYELGHLNRTVRTRLAEKIGGYGDHVEPLPRNEWLAEFQRAFNSSAGAETLITEQNIFRAIGEYERSQVFVTTPWKAYIRGDKDAISESAKRGAWLFFTPPEAGGAGCVKCHSGDFFTDENFHVLAIPQIGPGKGDGPTGDDDFGRFRASGNPADLYAFRTPTLLNVEVTGPYGHTGAYPTLEGIVRHHLNPVRSVSSYDFALLDPTVQTINTLTNTLKALAHLEENRQTDLSVLGNVNLSDDQVNDILSFLLSLTDPCVKDVACLAPWLPSGADPDGLQLQAVDREGRPLAPSLP